MTRLSRTRLSRAIITAVVLGVVGGAYVEYRRHHKASPAEAAATKPPAATQPTRVATATTPGTPPPVKPAGAPPMLAAANGQQPQPPSAQPTQPPAPPVAPTVSAARVLADAKAKANANDGLGARKLLNDALVAGGLSDADAAAVKKQLADVQQVLIFGSHAYPNDPLTATVKVPAGANLAGLAKPYAVPYELVMQLNHMKDPKRLRAGQSLKVVNGPFHAVVTKSKFTLDLYLGNPGGPGSTYVCTYPVGLGENDSTPTGMWEIRDKAPNPAYYPPHGGAVVPYGDPQNPLGPRWMGLEGTEGHAVGSDSYGIHGTVDPTSIGKMASAGCVRLRNEDAIAVYNLLVEKKSKVKVVD